MTITESIKCTVKNRLSNLFMGSELQPSLVHEEVQKSMAYTLPQLLQFHSSARAMGSATPISGACLDSPTRQ